MPAEPNVYDDADLFDSLELGGLRSPGVVTLSGHDDVVNWDVKAAEGQKGASLTRKGASPPEFTATYYMATDEEFAAWPAYRAVIDATVAGDTKAVDAYHPDLAVQNIRSVVKKSIGGTVHDKKGGRTIVVKFQVYAPPVKAGGSPSGSSAAGKKKGAAPDPNAAANAELAALTAQYRATPWGTL